MSVSERPIRACILISLYPPDFTGQGIQVQRMLPYLRDEGVDVEIVTARPPRSVTGIIDDEVPVSRILVPGYARGPQLQRFLRLSLWFRRNIRRFDVLHTIILDWGVYLNFPYLARCGIPILNEMILLGSDDPASIAKHQQGSFKIERMRRYVDLWVGLTGAFLPSIREMGIPEDRFRVLHGGVDVDAYRPRSPDERRALRRTLGLPEDARIAISVGAVTRRKGFDRLLHAWRASRPKLGRDLLLVVGPASEAEGLRGLHLAEAREVRELAESEGLKGTVRIVGRVQNGQEWMGASDLFVFLSRREGLGFVILEALATGLPSIVSPLDGIAQELLVDRETGFIADTPDDPESVASLIRQLREPGAHVERIAAAARKSAVERFSMEARAGKLAGMYRELAAEQRS